MLSVELLKKKKPSTCVIIFVSTQTDTFCMFACQKTALLPPIDEAGGAADIMPEECSTQETGERERGKEKEAAYANESMCREWRGPRQRYPESTQRICGKVIGADWGRGGLPGWIDSLSLASSLCLSSARAASVRRWWWADNRGGKAVSFPRLSL